MKRFWLAVLALALGFLLLFVILERLDFERTLVVPLARSAGPGAAALGVGLLIADVALPVPSSLVMVLHGVLFGLGKGALLSVIGGAGATLLAVWLGGLGEAWFRRWVTPEQHDRARRLLSRHGLLAIVITRPVPILAETVALVAGASGLGAGRALAGGVLGTLPAALLYAWVGARGLTPGGGGATVFAAVLGIAALLWVAGRRWR